MMKEDWKCGQCTHVTSQENMIVCDECNKWYHSLVILNNRGSLALIEAHFVPSRNLALALACPSLASPNPGAAEQVRLVRL